MRAVVAAATVLAATFLVGPARADLKVMDTEDVVRLVNGEEIRGTVVAVGIKALIVIVGEEERIVPRREVVSIRRGEVRPSVKGYQTEPVNGVKVVVGEGYRESESAGGEGEAAAAKPARKKGGKGGARSGRRKKPLISDNKVDELMRDPKVRDAVKKLGGRDKVMGLLEQNKNDPTVKRFMDEFMRTGRLPPGLERLFK